MISDGILDLHRAGALHPDAPIVTSFLIGSPELYRWADGNRRLRMLRTETVNDPARIAAHTSMLSVNAAMQVDLFAQANASFIAERIYSGFGGQPDFVAGALHSRGGRGGGAARLARKNGLVDGRTGPEQSHHLVPALGRRQRARMRRPVRALPAHAGAGAHRPGSRSASS